jgi:SAM-dependent methyltransferase
MNTVLETLFQQRPAAEQMLWLLRLRILAGAVAAAARVGVADALGDEPRSVEALATATGTQPLPLYRLLRALASAGIFAEMGPQTFAQTALSQTLRSGAPAGLHEFAMMYSAPWFAGALDELDYSLRTGEPCLPRALGKPGYQWLGEHPEESMIANRAMERYSDVVENGIIGRLELPSRGCIVDVGGGNGAFLAALLAQRPTLQGIVAELPQVVAQAQTLIAERGLAARCRVEPVDMFVELPAGGDVYVFKRVLHNWHADRVVTALRNCRRAMGPAGRLLIIENVIPEPDAGFGHAGRLFATLGDIQQLGLNGAGDRTEDEFRSLCAAAGFTIERFDRPTDFVTLIHARPQPSTSE